MMDDRFDDVLIEAACEYNEPPETPRELMWARIEAVREERARRRQQLRILYSPWTRWGVGIAAALAIGIGLGRLTIERGLDGTAPLEIVPQPVERGGAPANTRLAYRLAATEHLTRAETFLTSFRSEPQGGGVEFMSNAESLLSSTWLLLDSPAAEDPVFRTLLEELELVLVQIVQLGDYQEGAAERDIVTEGIERRGLLPRLRTAIPAGPSVGIEGVL